VSVLWASVFSRSTAAVNDEDLEHTIYRTIIDPE